MVQSTLTTRAAVMTQVGTIEVLERQVPDESSLPPGQALVAVEAVGVCGSDVAYYREGRIGDFVVDGPIVLGHEAAGRVVGLGPGAEASGLSVGDRVAIEPGTPDRVCAQCTRGRYNLCEHMEFLATPPYDGALTELMVMDARQLFVLPGSMSYEEGALLEPLSVGLWGCERAGVEPGDHVAITGAGAVGLLAAICARAMGASSVRLSDVATDRLELASSLGFGVVESGKGPSVATGADVLLECSGAPGVLATGLEDLNPAGRVAVIGLSHEDAVPLPITQTSNKELTVVPVFRYRHTWPTAIALVSSGRAEVASLVTHRFDLAGSADALEKTGAPGTVKMMISPQR